MRKPFGELALIERIRSATASGRADPRSSPDPAIALGIGDDCAILRPPQGHEVLVTTDFSLEGRHFRRDLHSPESVGHRVLARGLSDLAAMGAKPLAAFLSLALPADLAATNSGRRWLTRFFVGFNALARAHGVPLAGGDTSESPSSHVLADIVLVGSAPVGRSLRRSGARAGDALYVTGHLGGSAAELHILKRRGRFSTFRAAPRLVDPSPRPQLFPQPRLAVGRALLRRELATACIDLSDGLSSDIAHLCRESSVGAEIEATALPIHPLATRGAASGENDPLALALHGGEDYELLFAAPPSARVPRSIARVCITRIGTLTRRKTITLVDDAGCRQPMLQQGWEHFAPSR